MWSAKTFALSVLTAFIISMLLYALMLITSEPAPVDEIIVSAASAATSKVTVAAEYISPMWAIFIFNSIAALMASLGTGLFMFIHPLLISDIRMRADHGRYASVSIGFERMLVPGNRLLQKLAHRMDAGFPYTDADTPKVGFWEYCGYSREDYRMLAYMLPFTIPFLIMIVNGLLMGILLAFFVFNGSLTGFHIFGPKGIFLGAFYNLTYFVISILPHGIIEIPALLLAAALGYRLARIQSSDIVHKGLFLGNSYGELKADVVLVLDTVKRYMLSGYLWKMSAIMILMLLFAAYVETYVTLRIVERTMLGLDGFLGTISV
ncbi:stage II sporulation protein M [Methanolobus chelungpuianus]|uniref:Stage II sporulation protein M n=1 Tax=Methanolobus chelungpuianus TaxID=502115 RepID=A0AAE3HBZ0_9EURY|nr:stage II sporulation protein M [Methanolobus chelungpuianus]MCQ6963857.1 hypothetical protein [Methanolobus chelungpuianus]